MLTRTLARSAALACGLGLAALALPTPRTASASAQAPSNLSQNPADPTPACTPTCPTGQPTATVTCPPGQPTVTCPTGQPTATATCPPGQPTATCPPGQIDPYPATCPPGQPTLAPLSAPQRAAFLATPPDPPPEVLGGVTLARHDRHYLTGNEHNLHAFHPRIAGLGGAYLGVGAEQGYLLIGWARSELAWLIDYDPAVVAVHRLHQTFLAAAATPDAYLALWQAPGRRDALAALRAAHPGDADLLALYRDHRARIGKRLVELRGEMQAAGVPGYLADLADYTHVRELVRAGRVRSLVADLTRDGAVAHIGATARRLGVHLRVLYLSNAEEYWERLPQPFRANLRALPVDERSLVLRTLLTWEKNRDYRYNAQPARNYRRWLAVPDLRSIYDVIRRDRVIVDERGFFETRELPDPALLRRREQRRLAREAAGLPASG